MPYYSFIMSGSKEGYLPADAIIEVIENLPQEAIPCLVERIANGTLSFFKGAIFLPEDAYAALYRRAGEVAAAEHARIKASFERAVQGTGKGVILADDGLKASTAALKQAGQKNHESITQHQSLIDALDHIDKVYEGILGPKSENSDARKQIRAQIRAAKDKMEDAETGNTGFPPTEEEKTEDRVQARLKKDLVERSLLLKDVFPQFFYGVNRKLTDPHLTKAGLLRLRRRLEERMKVLQDEECREHLLFLTEIESRAKNNIIIAQLGKKRLESFSKIVEQKRQRILLKGVNQVDIDELSQEYDTLHQEARAADATRRIDDTEDMALKALASQGFLRKNETRRTTTDITVSGWDDEGRKATVTIRIRDIQENKGKPPIVIKMDDVAFENEHAWKAAGEGILNALKQGGLLVAMDETDTHFQNRVSENGGEKFKKLLLAKNVAGVSGDITIQAGLQNKIMVDGTEIPWYAGEDPQSIVYRFMEFRGITQVNEGDVIQPEKIKESE